MEDHPKPGGHFQREVLAELGFVPIHDMRIVRDHDGGEPPALTHTCARGTVKDVSTEIGAPGS